jgi:hypothetical protein
MNAKKAKRLRKLSAYLNLSPNVKKTYKAAKKKFKTLSHDKREKI